MKRFSKAGIALIALLTTANASAQINLTEQANEFSSTAKSIFPIVAGILFVIVALINLGHFTKEGGDYKKGLFNILLFVVVVGVIAGLYTYVTSISL